MSAAAVGSHGEAVVRERVVELARLETGPTPVISVYLNTRWGDEHQRDRVRAFLKGHLRAARAHVSDAGTLDDLAWVEAQGELLVSQARYPDAAGVALFACGARGVREIVPVRVPFEDRFTVDERPVLTPLVAALEESPESLVVFVDGTCARLVPLGLERVSEEIVLEHQVDRRHRRGGWALLAQSRYQRHIEHHRAEHFEAVAAALEQLVVDRGVARIVLAGETRAVALLASHLGHDLAARVIGAVSGTRHEPASALADRARELLARRDEARAVGDVDALITEAAKGGRAVVGLAPTLVAVARGAVHRLYVTKGFDGTARACGRCGMPVTDAAKCCTECTGAVRQIGLAEIVERVIAAGGDVELVGAQAGLDKVGGVAARLRYPVTLPE